MENILGVCLEIFIYCLKIFCFVCQTRDIVVAEIHLQNIRCLTKQNNGVSFRRVNI